jgi:hypothetical protein
MDTLKWLREYEVSTTRGKFKLFVAQHEGVGFYSSVLYWIRDVEGLECKCEKRFANSEIEAFDELKKWVELQFPGASISSE